MYISVDSVHGIAYSFYRRLQAGLSQRLGREGFGLTVIRYKFPVWGCRTRDTEPMIGLF